jgi:broad specificity phosphatase PhoE
MEIVLIRHGKPTSATNARLSASEFTHWIRSYNASDVAQNSRPVTSLQENYDSHYIISSNLKRAIHSTVIYTGKQPHETFSIFREMEIPRYKFPFRLKAWTWVYLNRVLWMLGLRGSFESYHQAKQRAEQASIALIALAEHKGKVVVFGHGYMNLHIRKSLVQKGWILNNKSNAYWGVTSLENRII